MRLQERVNQYHKDLNENELDIVAYILKNKEECLKLNIVELATTCHTSKSSVHRLTKKLGFSGFSEFKYFLKNDSEIVSVGKNLTQLQVDDINATLKLAKQSNMKEIVDAMKKANRIFGYGTGWGQINALRELSRNLMRTGKHVIRIPAKTEFELLLPTMTENDFVIIISLSGNLVEYEGIVNTLRIKHIPILGITAFTSNELAQKSQYNLYYHATPLCEAETTKTISFVTLHVICDTLFRAYIDQKI